MATVNTTYWLVSAPSANGEMFKQLNAATSSMSQNNLVQLPKLRSGTLDSLMTLSDDLAKHDQQVEGVLRKIERQLVDFDAEEFTVEVDHKSVITPAAFVTDFNWASNKYQERLSLVEINSKIHQDVMKIDDDLRTKQTEYNTLKSACQTLQRKQEGSLAVRSLAALKIDKAGFVDTENLVTVAVVVPKMDEQTWERSYEKILEKENLGFFPVLLRSSRKLIEDAESSMWSVTLLRRKLQDFKTALREKHSRWTVREFTVDDEQAQKENQNLDEAKAQMEKSKKTLQLWTKTMYGEVFRACIHLKMIRVFVEACLRFGVPPDFQTVLMRPNPKFEKKLRETLLQQFRHLGSAALYGQQDDSMPAGLTSSEFYPYVFFSFHVAQPAPKK